MRVISRATLRTFWESHADSEEALTTWYSEVSKATWASPNDAKLYASSVSLLANDRVCFNIKGNDYRLIVAVNYRNGVVFIKSVGTHREYNKIDVNTVEFKKGN